MVNINRGYNEELLQKCPVLKDYMSLVELIRAYKEDGRSADQAVDDAVKKCIEDGILAEFLTKHRAEVKDVCMTEFDEKAFIACMKEEGREENKRENALAMLKEKLSETLVVKCTGLSPEEVHVLAATLQEFQHQNPSSQPILYTFCRASDTSHSFQFRPHRH